jgi:hypothetical protein
VLIKSEDYVPSIVFVSFRSEPFLQSGPLRAQHIDSANLGIKRHYGSESTISPGILLYERLSDRLHNDARVNYVDIT